MKAASFAYYRPTDLQDALQILSEVSQDDGRILAGGQSLVPMMAYRIATPAHLVDINAIEELSELSVDDKCVSISACVRHAAFERIETPGPTGALLRSIAHHVAHYPIRVRGTFCGSLAHADPASEWCLLASTLGATLVTRNAASSREIAAADFFQGIMTIAMDPDDMLVKVRLPLLAPDERHAFMEFSRRAGDFAIASVLVTGRLSEGVIREPRIGVGGAEPTPRRLRDVENYVEGKAPEPNLLRQAAELAAAALQPLEDAINTADYRRDLVRALTRKCLTQAFA